MSKHVETVRAIYGAFGRGDVPAILAALSADIVWEYQPISTDVPWLQARRGHAGAGAFFELMGKELAVEAFAVKALCDGGSVVAALVDIEFTVKRTGKRVQEIDEVHLWHFDASGQVVRFRHVSDTHQQQRAWSP